MPLGTRSANTPLHSTRPQAQNYVTTGKVRSSISRFLLSKSDAPTLSMNTAVLQPSSWKSSLVPAASRAYCRHVPFAPRADLRSRSHALPWPCLALAMRLRLPRLRYRPPGHRAAASTAGLPPRWHRVAASRDRAAASMRGATHSCCSTGGPSGAPSRSTGDDASAAAAEAAARPTHDQGTCFVRRLGGRGSQ
jgi:hypothetical protein